MPTASETASAEADLWWQLAGTWGQPPQGVIAPSEVVLLPGFDPLDDLRRRMRPWGNVPEGSTAADVCVLAAALASAEARAWVSEDHPTATRAFTDRRHLVTDRLLPWFVPWLLHLEELGHGEGGVDAATILDLTDSSRPAPLLTGDEGIHPPGHDAYGSTDVALQAALESLAGGRIPRGEGASDGYRSAAAAWSILAERHPGSARLWRDLCRRALRTATMIEGGRNFSS